MVNPIVSVIIPVFNAERFLEQTIKSVLNQTLDELEILIIDDASFDNSVNIAEKFANKDARVRLYKNKKNSGPSYSRNVGVKEAKGTWIAVLDADDLYSPKRLEVLTQLGDDLDVDIIADNMHLIDETENRIVGKFLDHKKFYSQFISPKAFVIGNMLHHTTIPALGYLKPVFRRSFLYKNDISYMNGNDIGEDFSFLLDCLINGAIFYYYEKPFYSYRNVLNSLSKKKNHLKQLRSKLRLNLGHLNNPKIKNNKGRSSFDAPHI